ncbi:hypothetical protein JOD31_000595 [Methylopila capsulata]|uniref:DUF2946 domain-containing protein n=1 Tax=Methylopila capsulata TaxID=61654 RepID=A0ABS2T2J7_9HYPH|nr:hypothetical protein [Methylopila capsulata]MBM7850383.1 hypothetical protein [Methylopila capsulata]
MRGLLLAYLLVLQAALGGLALGSQPISAAAADVHCGSWSGPAEGSGKGHAALPGCCVAGCLMLGAVMAPPPSFPATPVAGDDHIVRASAEAQAAAPALFERSPRSTRGPPAEA